MYRFVLTLFRISLCNALLFSTLAFSTVALAEPLPVQEVAPGVFVHQGVHEELTEGYHGDIANIGFVVGKTAVAVIDTGGTLAVGQRLREAVRQVTDLPIAYVINTHVHPDHIYGDGGICARSSAIRRSFQVGGCDGAAPGHVSEKQPGSIGGSFCR